MNPSSYAYRGVDHFLNLDVYRNEKTHGIFHINSLQAKGRRMKFLCAHDRLEEASSVGNDILSLLAISGATHSNAYGISVRIALALNFAKSPLSLAYAQELISREIDLFSKTACVVRSPTGTYDVLYSTTTTTKKPFLKHVTLWILADLYNASAIIKYAGGHVADALFDNETASHVFDVLHVEMKNTYVKAHRLVDGIRFAHRINVFNGRVLRDTRMSPLKATCLFFYLVTGPSSFF